MSSQGVEVSSSGISKQHPKGFSNANPNLQDSYPLLIPKKQESNVPHSSKAKSTYGTTEADRVLYYKEKAHQSFMQVIQMEELHNQELEQLKEEYKSKVEDLEKQLKAKVAMLKQKQETINSYENNSKKFIFEGAAGDLSSIDIVESNSANFINDQSFLTSFHDILQRMSPKDSFIYQQKNSLFGAIIRILKVFLEKLQINDRQAYVQGLFEEVKSKISFKMGETFNNLFERGLLKREQVSTYQISKKLQSADKKAKKLSEQLVDKEKEVVFLKQNLKKLCQKNLTLEQRISRLQKLQPCNSPTNAKFQENNLDKQLRMTLPTQRVHNLRVSYSPRPTRTDQNYEQVGQEVKQNKLNLPDQHFQAFKAKSSCLTKRGLENGEVNGGYRVIKSFKSQGRFSGESPSKQSEDFNLKELIYDLNESKQLYKQSTMKQNKSYKILTPGSRLLVSTPASRTRKKSFDC